MATTNNIVFGSGPVGIAVTLALLRRNEPVTVVNRSGNLPAAMNDERVESVACNLMDTTQVHSVTRDANRIFHCANPLYHQWKDMLPLMQQNIVEAAIEHNAFLAVSENLYAYTSRAHRIDEETPVDPPTKKGRIRAELSYSLNRCADTTGLTWTSIRASDYYGPWSTYQSVFGKDRFLDAVAKKRNPGLIGNLDMPHSYTYIEDFGEALVIAALDPRAHGHAWICPNAPASTTGEIARDFITAMQSNDPITPRRVPDFLLHVAGVFNPLIRELPEMLYQKRQPYIANGSLFSETFGFNPTSIEEGIRRTIEWYRNAN